MKYTIYETTNLITGRRYIGKHKTSNPNDSYLGSGLKLLEAVDKYGASNFSKEVLFVFDNRDEMDAKEAELVTQEVVYSDDYYNLCLGGSGGFGMTGKAQSNHQKSVVSRMFKDVKKTEQHKANHRKSLMETFNDPTYIHPNKGRKLSEEHKEKVANAVRNRPLYTCEVCGTIVKGKTNYVRWHGSNCKKRAD